MPTIRRVAALGCYIVASTLLVVTLRVGPDPGGSVRLWQDRFPTVRRTRLFEVEIQATEPFVAAYDPAIRPRRAAPPDCAREPTAKHRGAAADIDSVVIVAIPPSFVCRSLSPLSRVRPPRSDPFRARVTRESRRADGRRRPLS